MKFVLLKLQEMCKIITISVSIQRARLFERLWIIVFSVEVSEISQAVHCPQVSEIAFYIHPLHNPYVTTKLKFDTRSNVAHRPFKAYGLLYVTPILTSIFLPYVHTGRLCSY